MDKAVSAVLSIAEGELGYLEKASNAFLDDKTANAGSGNWTKYARDIDALGDVTWGNKNGLMWCAEFVLWVFYKAFGIDKGLAVQCSPKPTGIPVCSYGVSYFRNAGRWTTSAPEPGDVIFFQSGGEASHTGIVTGVSATQVFTIEGNTSNMVARRSYRLGDPYVLGYGRPKYELVTDEDIAAGGSAGSAETPQEPASGQAGVPGHVQTAPAAQPQPVILKKGAKSAAVNELQTKLIRLGYDLGRWGADGEFGNDTLAAVLKFQRSAGLLVDGEVGDLTRAALDKALAAVGKDDGDADGGSGTGGGKVSGFAVGDIVRFTGTKHYISANASYGSACRPGFATITKIHDLGRAKHPYHAVRVAGCGATVNGWVDESAVEEV